MKHLTLILCLLIIHSLTAYAQQKEVAKFRILEFKKNDEDYTNWALKRAQFLAFYENKTGNLCMANVCGNCEEQSYGRLYWISSETLKETEKTYKANIFKFRWKYANNYDDKTGSAIVEFVKIYKPQGIAFELKMFIENLDVLLIKGYM